MAPIVRRGEHCITSYDISIDHNNTTPATSDYNEEDKQALLYIVCTLLFYSLGMMVGIVSYIKREKQDIEQDRMFDKFLTSFSGKSEALHYRQLKVQETVERLAELERIRKVEGDSYREVDSRKRSSDGTILADKLNLVKSTNSSVLCGPVMVLADMTSVTANEPFSDTETVDPFPDRRISEVLLSIEIQNEKKKNNIGDSRNEGETQTVTIDNSKAPIKKLLFFETMQAIDESDLEYVLDSETDASGDSNNADLSDLLTSQMQYKSENSIADSQTVSSNGHHSKTIANKTLETVFGVTLPQESVETIVEEKPHSETEIGPDAELTMTTSGSMTSV